MNINFMLDKIQLFEYSKSSNNFHQETLREFLIDNYAYMTGNGYKSDYVPVFAAFGDDFDDKDEVALEKIRDKIMPDWRTRYE